jgi:hypothetical protein
LFPYANGGKTWLSGHGPDQHPVYFSGFGWSADLHAANGTAVQARFQSSDGNITLRVAERGPLSCSPSAGEYVKVEVKVDGVLVGQVLYEHLANVQVSANQVIAVGATLGYLNAWGQSSCWADTLSDGVVHTHIEAQKGCYRNLSAWTNYSAATPVGMLAQGYNNTNSSTCSETDIAQVMSGSSNTTPTPVLVVRSGGVLNGKEALTAPWVEMLDAGATDVRAAGGRITFTDTSGNLWAKDGLGGAWINVYGPASQYAASDSLLVVRDGSTLFGKAGLSEPWVTLSTGVVDVRVSGSRITYTDVSGNVWAKDGLGGTWHNEYGSVNQYAASSSILAVRTGSTVLAKAGLADAWSTLTYIASDVKAAGNRIAITDTSGNIWAKDGIGGTWYNVYGPVDQYAAS